MPVPGMPGSHPFAPTTNGDLAGKTDPGAWEIWWAFNQARYLDLRRHVNGLGRESGDGGFHLGDGQSDGRARAGGPPKSVIDRKVTPALLEALKAGGAADLVNSLMVAIAKIGDPRDEADTARFEYVIRFFLDSEVRECADTAAIALGILASEGSIDSLEHLLADTARGRELVGEDEVDYRTRAYAAFAMGLIGHRSESQDFKRRVVRALVEAVELDDEPTKDVQVAAMISLGLVRLDTDETCSCGGSDPEHAPDSSRQALLHYLLSYYCKPRENPWLVRAHCATSLARQLQNVGDYDYKEPVAEALMASLRQATREQLAVRQSAILALGLVGDADDDEIDARIRLTLTRMTGHTEEQCRRFALIAMGQVGGRPGDDARNPLGAAPEIRSFLLKQLVRGKKGTRSWAAIALGVMGWHLTEAGERPCEDVSRALRSSVGRARTPSEFGAYSIALGLRHDPQAAPVLAQRMAGMKDDAAAGHAALALGMIGDRAAIEPLQRLLRGSLQRPTLHRQAAVALALLGDSVLSSELISTLGSEEVDSGEREACATALSYIGDARFLDQMAAMLTSDDLDDRTRGFVAMALGQIGDTDLLPWNSPLSADINYLAGTETMTNPHGTGIIDRR